MLYISIFEPAEEGGYNITFPDFPTAFTCADNYEDAKYMAKDCLECHTEGEALPVPTKLQDIEINTNGKSIVYYVELNSDHKVDFYLNEDNVYNRLLREYQEYGNIIVALDFDLTIHDFHKEGHTFDDVISLIKKCNELNLKVVIWTANKDEKYILDHCESIGIKIEGVNIDVLPQFDGRKMYYNILLDDRAGLATSYKLLKRLVGGIYGIQN